MRSTETEQGAVGQQNLLPFGEFILPTKGLFRQWDVQAGLRSAYAADGGELSDQGKQIVHIDGCFRGITSSNGTLFYSG